MGHDNKKKTKETKSGRSKTKKVGSATKRLTKTDIGRALNLSTNSIRKHLGRDDAPQADGSGKFNLNETALFIKQRQVQDKAKPQKGREACEAIKAQLLFLELQEKQGAVVPAAEVEKYIVEKFGGLAKQLQALPAAISGRLYRKKRKTIESVLTEAMKELCNQYAAGKDPAEPKTKKGKKK